jgi:short-subunit dehydrogenase
VGAKIGVPFLTNDGGAKAYIHSLGEALHYEFKPRGVYVTVVPPPLTNTAVLAKLGFDPRTMPMKPMSVEQCVSEGLNAAGKPVQNSSGPTESLHGRICASFRETDVHNEELG